MTIKPADSSDTAIQSTGPVQTFHELELPEALLRATDELGFDACTEIQGLTLPVIAAGHDIAAQAQTGTGKTAAFLLGSFARLMSNDGGERRKDQPRMLVIAPTRELAMQIKKDADSLGVHTGLKCAVVYGGIDYEKQRRELAAGVDVLIGTPGRLIDYFKQKIFDLKKLEIVVLDEADRMFDLGFIADIRFLLRRMPPPPERLSMLFSATLSHRVMELAYEHMDNPAAIKTETTGVTADGVRQALYQPATDEKIPLLLGLLKSLDPARSIIFVNTKRTAERIENYLMGNDIACGTLSGDVRQNKRQAILAEFTSGSLPILIATDVAARGLHIDDVSHVFNYDLPQQAEDYVHRIGRTARAGTQGMAVSFACENYSFSLPEIQEFIGQSIPLEMITDELLIKPKPPMRIQRDRVGSGPGGKGGRQGGRDKSSKGGRTAGGRARTGRSGRSSGAQGESRSRNNPAERKAGASTAKASPAVDDNTASRPDTAASGGQSPGDSARKPRRRRRRRKPAADSGTVGSEQAVPGNKQAASDNTD
ncbi:MAG: DEAD/DEAH box helicase [Granulosicoccus sp.]|nr:DEAD/DEAH box helicase [Granulosicoccus sp.]